MRGKQQVEQPAADSQPAGETNARLWLDLGDVFSVEWFALSRADRALIVRDCTEDGGVQDLAEYRRLIGRGNLRAYAKTQRVRFARLDGRRA